MDSTKIKALFLGALALFVAIYLGIAAATAQMEAVGWVLGGLVLVIGISLGRKIFLIIPLMSSLALVLPVPGNFDTTFISYVIFLGFSLPLFLMRKLPLKGGFTELEFWCALLIATVLQAYFRNPVGLNIFGSAEVGAKPYGIFFITALAAFVLSLLAVDLKELRTWAKLSFLGSILNFSIGALGWMFPSVGMYLGATFSTDVSAAQEGALDGRATRIGFVRNLSVALATWISSKISPLRGAFHPLWLLLILIALGFAAVSGFRSQLIHVGFILFIGICYRGGFRSLVVASLLGVLGLTLLAFVNAVAPLPPNIQRSLTFLPGTWEQEFRDDAEGSTEWRMDMWKDALLTDRWIDNKLMGDGLGFTREELERMQTFADEDTANIRGSSGLTLQQENFMISGSYHSGPIHTIRTTGYVGLIVLLVAMARLVTHTHRVIRRCRGTEWEWVALFIGIPLIVTPFYWTFVFGTFERGAAGLLIGAAIIRLFEKNLHGNIRSSTVVTQK